MNKNTYLDNLLLNVQGKNISILIPEVFDTRVKEAKLKFCGDKGISVGETSKVIVENLFISNANIGIAAKDYGVVNISKGEIYSTKSCIEAYNKKQEYSGGSVISNELKC